MNKEQYKNKTKWFKSYNYLGIIGAMFIEVLNHLNENTIGIGILFYLLVLILHYTMEDFWIRNKLDA